MITEVNLVEATAEDTYGRLIGLLVEGRARYRLIDHEPEGQTVRASELRGHALSRAAKCLILRVRLGKRSSRYVLAVIPGDRHVDLGRVSRLFGGTHAYFASTEVAEHLAGSPSGTIVPFSFVSGLTLVADPTLLVHGSVFFNAARLNASVELNVEDYLRLGSPFIFPIVQ